MKTEGRRRKAEDRRRFFSPPSVLRLPPSVISRFDRFSDLRGAFGGEGVDELLDAEGFVEDEAKTILASLDDGVRGIVAIAGHENDACPGLSLPELAVDVVARKIGQ